MSTLIVVYLFHRELDGKISRMEVGQPKCRLPVLFST